MTELAQQAGALLLTYGAGGVVAALAVAALVLVWRHARGVQDQLALVNAARADDAERRLQETKAIAEKAIEGLQSTTSSVVALSVAFDRTTQLNEQRLIALQTMAAGMEPLGKDVGRQSEKLDRLVELVRDFGRERRA